MSCSSARPTRPPQARSTSPITLRPRSVAISLFGWPVPERILDLFAEFRRYTNGLPTLGGAGLLGALAYFGIDGIDAGEKAEMRDLVLRADLGAKEREAILEYCASDVAGLARLLPLMAPHIDLPRALLRGRYMAAAARMERDGVPIDVETLKLARFEEWLIHNRIPWPRLDSGQLDLTDRTFREMARAHPSVAPLRELRGSLSELRLQDLSVGRDGNAPYYQPSGPGPRVISQATPGLCSVLPPGSEG